MNSTNSKRLLFDRRYGWVLDEWKDPSEEALAGGRGMFCLLPLGKAFLNTASKSIDVAASSTVKVLERRDLYSAHVFVNDQLQKLTSFAQKQDLSCFKLR